MLYLIAKEKVEIIHFLTKSDTPPWVFLMFFELYIWYQIAQHITNVYVSQNEEKTFFFKISSLF